MLVKSSQNTQSKHYYGVKTYIQKSLGKDLIEFIPKTHKKVGIQNLKPLKLRALHKSASLILIGFLRLMANLKIL